MRNSLLKCVLVFLHTLCVVCQPKYKVRFFISLNIHTDLLVKPDLTPLPSNTSLTRHFLVNSYYRGADKTLAQPGRKQANVCLRMAWISFGALPCRKSNLMTARFSVLLKSRASLTCFRACVLPGRAKDLSAPHVIRDDTELFFLTSIPVEVLVLQRNGLNACA